MMARAFAPHLHTPRFCLTPEASSAPQQHSQIGDSARYMYMDNRALNTPKFKCNSQQNAQRSANTIDLPSRGLPIDKLARDRIVDQLFFDPLDDCWSMFVALLLFLSQSTA